MSTHHGPDLAAWQRAAAQRKFLTDHLDLISPWLFPLTIRVQMAEARLVAGWRRCAEKANGGQ